MDVLVDLIDWRGGSTVAEGAVGAARRRPSGRRVDGLGVGIRPEGMAPGAHREVAHVHIVVAGKRHIA